MIFSELEDQAIKRLARHMSVLDGKSSYTFHGPRQDMRATVEAHLKAKRIIDSPELEAALGSVRGAEARIRKLKLSGLSSKEVRDFERSIFSELTKAVEDRKHKRIMKLANEIDERRKKVDTENPTARLLQLEEAKLRFSKIGEKQALSMLNRFERYGYSREALLVLGSISSKTAERANLVRGTIPEFMADQQGVEMLRELEHLVSSKIGHVEYHFAGSDAVQSIHVADLLSETAPSLQDISV